MVPPIRLQVVVKPDFLYVLLPFIVEVVNVVLVVMVVVVIVIVIATVVTVVGFKLFKLVRLLFFFYFLLGGQNDVLVAVVVLQLLPF